MRLGNSRVSMRTHPLKMHCDGDSARVRGLSESSVFANPARTESIRTPDAPTVNQSGRTPSVQWTREVALSAAPSGEATGLMLIFREG